MSWIQAHQELGSHYKTRRLARTLGISVPQAVGHVMLLWWWCVDYAPDGDLEGFEPVEIAEAAQYDGDPEAFVTAMQDCGRNGRGFLNGLQINDWADYTDGYKKLQEAGVLGNHRRWHTARNVTDPGCPHCTMLDIGQYQTRDTPLRADELDDFKDQLLHPEWVPDSPPMSPPISGGIPVQSKPTQDDTVSGGVAPDVAPESEERRGEETKPPPTPPKGDGDDWMADSAGGYGLPSKGPIADGIQQLREMTDAVHGDSMTDSAGGYAKEVVLPDEVEGWVEIWASKEYADRLLTPSLKKKWTVQVEKHIGQFGAPTRGTLRRARDAGINHPAGWEWHIPADRKPAESEPDGCRVLGHVWAQVEDDERICSRCRDTQTRDESGDWT